MFKMGTGQFKKLFGENNFKKTISVIVEGILGAGEGEILQTQ